MIGLSLIRKPGRDAKSATITSADHLLQLRVGVRAARLHRQRHKSDSEVRRQSRESGFARTQLRQRPGHTQSDKRSGSNSLSTEARRQTRRGKMGARRVGMKCWTISRGGFAKRSSKIAVRKSCITSGVPAKMDSPNASSRPGASTATTRTRTSVLQARARAINYGWGSIGPVPITPTRKSFC
jgi:hypothetical protein